jgi:hypothetical protein
MVRKLLAAMFCVGICLSLAVADEFKGKVKSVDTDKKCIIVDVDGKDMTFMVKDDTKFMAGKKDTELKGGLAAKALKEGADVTIKTPEGDKKNAIEVRVKGGKKKANN